MKKKKIALKPRNHVVLAMAKRSGAGTHRTTNKAMRQKEKMALKRQETFKVSFFTLNVRDLPLGHRIGRHTKPVTQSLNIQYKATGTTAGTTNNHGFFTGVLLSGSDCITMDGLTFKDIDFTSTTHTLFT